jgi:hypothetical protein
LIEVDSVDDSLDPVNVLWQHLIYPAIRPVAGDNADTLAFSIQAMQHLTLQYQRLIDCTDPIDRLPTLHRRASYAYTYLGHCYRYQSESTTADVREKARKCYYRAMALNASPALFHHLASLCRHDGVEAAMWLYKSLLSPVPFGASRDALMALFADPSHALIAHLHAPLFCGIDLDRFVALDCVERLQNGVNTRSFISILCLCEVHLFIFGTLKQGYFAS